MSLCRRCGGSGVEPDWKAVGCKARQARMNKGLSQREAAKKANVSPAYLCDLENGRRGWQGDGAQRVAEVLGFRSPEAKSAVRRVR